MSSPNLQRFVSREYSAQIGNSLFDEAGSQKVAALIQKAKQNNIKVVFPVDFSGCLDASRTFDFDMDIAQRKTCDSVTARVASGARDAP